METVFSGHLNGKSASTIEFQTDSSDEFTKINPLVSGVH